MNKTELIRETAKAAEKTIKETTEIVNALQDTIMKTLTSGESIKIVGFGNLEVKDVAERKARNPQDGSEFVVPAHKTVKAKLAKAVKDAAK